MDTNSKQLRELSELQRKIKQVIDESGVFTAPVKVQLSQAYRERETIINGKVALMPYHMGIVLEFFHDIRTE